MQSIQFSDKFFLTVKELGTKEVVAKPKQLPTNFLFVIDVSGSMYGELDQIRKQLKNKLPSLVKEGDTITIIWFSGRSDSGILMEEVEIKSLTNLQSINAAIDKFLKPIGATAFYKPLVLAKEAIARIRKNRQNSLFSLIFLTDGYNNDCSWSDVIKSLKSLESDLSASTFVEYGYYADSRRIAEMAEMVGGEKVEAQRFDDYDVVFESKIQKTYSSAKKVLVDIPATNLFDFAFTISSDNEIILYSMNNGQVMIPGDTEKILFFSNKAAAKEVIKYSASDKELNRLIYTSVYVLTDKLKNEFVDPVFRVLGDVGLYKTYTNAFGKEKLMNFKSLVKECVTNEAKRFEAGRSNHLVADDNAYCIMNLIDDLTKDDDARLFTSHDDFSYKRTGVKRVSAAGALTEEEKKLIASASTVEEAKRLTESIAASKEPELKFVSNPDKGSRLTDLVWASKRANLSIPVVYYGKIALPKNNFGLNEIETRIHRNFTIIKDGILNINRLPVSISQGTYDKLVGQKLIDSSNAYEEGKIYTVEFGHLPVVNRSMVKSISAKKLGEKEYELIKLKALEKVYKHYEELVEPKESKGFVEQYGKEAEEWLKNLGITERNGYSPKTVAGESNDVYMAVELETKIAKHSTSSTVAALLKKIEDGKPLNEIESLMKVAVDDYNSQIKSALYKSMKDEEMKKGVLINWLKAVKENVKTNRRRLLQEIAEVKFALILSKKWFEEFASFEENSLDVTIDKKKLSFKFEMSDTEVKV